jgi:hypothetical protein
VSSIGSLNGGGNGGRRYRRGDSRSGSDYRESSLSDAEVILTKPAINRNYSNGTLTPIAPKREIIPSAVIQNGSLATTYAEKAKATGIKFGGN